ncbi:MAG TPA: hypothetical protein VJN92_15580 [Candidatus Acidoferrum sp.]|nr:hypothetical protein [Candidatus Acidoferrum sp.]
MTPAQQKRYSELISKRNDIFNLMAKTKMGKGEVMTYEEHLEFEALYIESVKVGKQLEAIFEEDVKRIRSLFVPLVGGSTPAHA